MNPITCKHLSKDDITKAQKLIRNRKNLIKSVDARREHKKKSSDFNKRVLDRFAELCYTPTNDQNDSHLDINREFNLYMSTYSQSDDFSKYWQTFSSKLPILTCFVKSYSIIPASSVASESAFSIANYIQRKERSNLSSKMLQYSMILREFYLESQHIFLTQF